MSLSDTEIKAIAWLARLALDETALPDYRQDMGNILDLVGQMQAVDTQDVAPLAHPLDLVARRRPDQITEINQRDKFQKLAQAVASGHYLVPRVIE